MEKVALGVLVGVAAGALVYEVARRQNLHIVKTIEKKTMEAVDCYVGAFKEGYARGHYEDILLSQASSF
jgi:hypothetical protein